MSGGWDDLIAEAQRRAESSGEDDDWGYRIQLEPGETFVGFYRGETVDRTNGDRRVFLFKDNDGADCYSRFYTALAREIDARNPQIDVGDRVAVSRGQDYQTTLGMTGFSFGVAVKPNAQPLFDQPAGDTGDDIPFQPTG